MKISKSAPKIELGEKHFIARRVSKPLEVKAYSASLYCDCCGLPLNNQLLPLNCSRNSLAFLGPGITLYFESLILCIILLSVHFLTYGVFITYVNYKNYGCMNVEKSPESNEIEIKIKCQYSLVNALSIANKLENIDDIRQQNWVSLGSLILMELMFLYTRGRLQKLDIECDENIVSPSDFSLEVRGSAEESLNKESLENSLNEIIISLSRKTVTRKLIYKFNFLFNFAVRKYLINKITRF